MKNHLINESNINFMLKKDNEDFNIKKLLDNYNLDQSQCIRFGTVFENFIKSIIKSKNLELINDELLDVYETGNLSKKGKKELDICFIKDNTIYYLESKMNLNLDSEKSKATDYKIYMINNFLIKENKNYNVNSGIITCWYEEEKNLKITTKSNLFYMKDFFKLLDINIDKNDYYALMKEFGNILKQ